MDEFWKHGQQTALANAVGILPQNLSSVLHRRRHVSRDLALILERESEKVLGFTIPKEAWIFNADTDHPAFYKKET